MPIIYIMLNGHCAALHCNRLTYAYSPRRSKFTDTSFARCTASPMLAPLRRACIYVSSRVRFSIIAMVFLIVADSRVLYGVNPRFINIYAVCRKVFLLTSGYPANHSPFHAVLYTLGKTDYPLYGSPLGFRCRRHSAVKLLRLYFRALSALSRPLPLRRLTRLYCRSVHISPLLVYLAQLSLIPAPHLRHRLAGISHPHHKRLNLPTVVDHKQRLPLMLPPRHVRSSPGRAKLPLRTLSPPSPVTGEAPASLFAVGCSLPISPEMSAARLLISSATIFCASAMPRPCMSTPNSPPSRLLRSSISM